MIMVASYFRSLFGRYSGRTESTSSPEPSKSHEHSASPYESRSSFDSGRASTTSTSESPPIQRASSYTYLPPIVDHVAFGRSPLRTAATSSGSTPLHAKPQLSFNSRWASTASGSKSSTIHRMSSRILNDGEPTTLNCHVFNSLMLHVIQIQQG
jgi:hypothetical protein